MRYILTFLWSFFLVTMLNYVAGSIVGVGFDFKAGVIASVVLGVIAIIVTATISDEPVADL